MKTKNLLMLLAVAGLMIFASCKKSDDTPSPLTADEATAAITTVDGDYSAAMVELQALPGKQAIDALDELDLPAPMKAPTRQESVRRALQKVTKSSSLKSDGFFPFDYFNFDYYKGTWRYADGYWTKYSTEPTTKAVFEFNYGIGTNNARITYSNYDESTETFMGSEETFMSSLSARIDIDGQTNPVMSFEYTASGSGSTTSGIAKMNYVYHVGEYTRTNSLSVNLTMTGLNSGKITLSMLDEIKKNSNILYSTSFSLSATGSESSGVNVSINAKFRISDIIVKYDINFDETTNTDGDPSEWMAISVWTAGGAKVADVVFHYEEYEYVAYFKLADDSEVLVSEYLSEDLYLTLQYFPQEMLYMFYMFAGGNN
jgi:hypothetical protein